MVIEVSSEYRAAIASIADMDVGTVRWNEPLCIHSSWQIGGPADLLVEPASVRQVLTLLDAVSSLRVPLVVIGSASNLLFDDAGVRGVVVKIGHKLAGFKVNGHRMIVEAGMWVPHFARMAANAGLSGFEHTIGIPGTLGGLVLMNGGSQRKSIGDAIIRVYGVTRQGDEVCLERDECAFSYRHSKMQDSGLILLRVELEGTPGNTRNIRREMLDILRDRRLKFPLKQPNCGSVFLSTPELHAAYGPPGKIIEDAGLKGLRVGDAQVSLKHANFIVNRGTATAKDTLKLIREVRDLVASRIGVDLLTEVLSVSENGIIDKILG